MEESRRAQVGKYTIIKTLGEGATGVAKSAEHTDTKEQVALKILKRDFMTDNALKEIEILSDLDHKHIINLIEFLNNVSYKKKNGNEIKKNVIVMELASQGDFLVIVIATASTRKTGLSEKTTRTFFQQMVEAVEYCHGQKVVHRDIKPDNILLDKDYNIKLADFGWATISDAKLHQTEAGTKCYFAPEMQTFQPFEIVPIDIFCLGIMLFMMRLGVKPFEKATKIDPKYRDLYNKTPDLYWKKISRNLSEKDVLSVDFKKLIEGMLEHDPKKRFTIADIKASKWYQGETADRTFIEEEISILREEMNKIYKKEAENRRKDKQKKREEQKMLAEKNSAAMEEERHARAKKSMEEEQQKNASQKEIVDNRMYSEKNSAAMVEEERQARVKKSMEEEEKQRRNANQNEIVDNRMYSEKNFAAMEEEIQARVKKSMEEEEEQRRNASQKEIVDNRMYSEKNSATMEEETKRETAVFEADQKMEEEIPSWVYNTRGGSRSGGRDKLESVDEYLLALEINLDESSRKIKIKTENLTAPFTFDFCVDLKLLFKCLVWVSKKLFIESDISESTYMIKGTYIVSEEVPEVSEEVSEVVQMKINVYQIGNEGEYTVEFVKTKGEYYVFTKFVYEKFFAALKDLIEEITSENYETK